MVPGDGKVALEEELWCLEHSTGDQNTVPGVGNVEHTNWKLEHNAWCGNVVIEVGNVEIGP